MNKNNFIIPAIDIIDGRLVRLTRGDFAQQAIYDKDPLSMAKSFELIGLSRLHLVDLDGARSGKIQNLPVLEKIAKDTSLVIDFGGGIQSRNDILDVLNAGAQMITIGSIAVKQPELLKEWISEFGPDKFFIGADVQEEQLKINGWLQEGGIDIYSFIENMNSIGVQYFFCTDILKDGALQGTSLDLYKNIITKFPGISLTASGGVSCMNDIIDAQNVGCKGVIVGKAIYEGRITLQLLKEFNLLSQTANNAL